MKSSKSKRLIALMLTVVTLVTCFSFSVSASAVDSGIYFNHALSPITGNASVASFPASFSSASVGQRVYVNAACTSDISYIRSYTLYLKKPGQSSYNWYACESSKSFIRWAYFEINPTTAGTYNYRVVVTSTSGGTASGEGSFYVSTASSRKVSMSYTPSASYQSSTYYRNLMNVTLTGNYHTDLVRVAASQVGYHEGALNGTGTGSNNYTEYGRWYGSSNASWCAIFIGWAARQAGIPTSKIRNTGWATASDLGLTWHEKGYKPAPGDIIVFDYSPYCTKTPRSAYGDHVGIVEKVENGKVYTIEGNSSNRVERCSYSLTNSSIKGYGTY